MTKESTDQIPAKDQAAASGAPAEDNGAIELPAGDAQENATQDKPDIADATTGSDDVADDSQSTKQQPAAADSNGQAPPAAGPNKSGSGLAVLALLFALASLFLVLWLYLQSQQAPHDIDKQAGSHSDSLLEGRIDELNQLLEQQRSQLNQLVTQLAELPNSDNFAQQQLALKQMQSAHQAFSMRFEAAFGNTRQDWRLAEAEHLVRMAILRLNAMQDLVSARHLIEGADQILFEQDDVAAYPAREALSQALADIRAMPALDRTGLFLRLGALQNQISQLDQLMPGFESGKNGLLDKATDSSFWRQWLDGLSDYVRLDFNSSEQVRPLLSSQEITHIRLALSLAVEQAQWAALNGQQAAYDSALEQAMTLLQHYFPQQNQQAASLHEQLAELAGAPVSQQMPDIQPALLALQAYIHDRTMQYRTRNEEQQ